MNKRLLRIFSLVICLIVVQSSCSFAVENNILQDLDPEVRKIIEQNLKESRMEIPEIEIYETDLDGNLIDCEQENNLMKNDATTIYMFDRIEMNDMPLNNPYYKAIGTFMVENKGLSPMNVKYKQIFNTEVLWNVSANIEAKKSIGNRLLGEIEGKLGISVGRSKSWYEGTEFGIETVLNSMQKGVLVNYQVGTSSVGRIVYNKFSVYPDATLEHIGYKYETYYGTVVNQNDVHIVFYNDSLPPTGGYY